MFNRGHKRGSLEGRTDTCLWELEQVFVALCDITKGQVSIGCVFVHTLCEELEMGKRSKGCEDIG